MGGKGKSKKKIILLTAISLDKRKCFKPDPVLMEQIIEMFVSYCGKE